MRTFKVTAKYIVKDGKGNLRELFALKNDLWVFSPYECKNGLIEIPNKGIISVADGIFAGTSAYTRWSSWALKAINDAISGKLTPIWTDNSITKAAPKTMIKNNDNRDICYRCHKPTSIVAGAISIYSLCTNPDCEWFRN